MPFDPRLIAVFCLVFICLGVFSITNGNKRLQEARAQGQKIAWYRHISILTGIEYILLALTFLTSVSIKAGWLPKSWTQFLVPFYLIMLVASIALACVVIFQVLRSPRRARPAPQAARSSVGSNGSVASITAESPHEMTEEERETQVRKRRERRQNAAKARRRRTGKA